MAWALAVPAFAAAPTISSFTPTSGPLRTSVKIMGSNFVAPVTVKFNGTAATSVVVNSSTQVTAQVPGSANSGPISVTSGGSTATSSASFTVTPGVYVPTAAGPPGTKVSVYFSGFAAYEAVDVYFDSTDLKLVSASGTGSGVATPIVPAKAGPGEHFFTAVGRKSGNSAQAPFTVRTDWPQFANNGAHTGENTSESVLDGSNVKKLTRTWNSATASYAAIENQAVVGGGTVYNVYNGAVTALSANTGATMWTRTVNPAQLTPALAGSVLLVGTQAGHVVGLNAATGATKFDVSVGSYVSHPIVVAGSTAFAMTYDDVNEESTLAAIDAGTGAVKWSQTAPTRCSEPAQAGALLYFTCSSGRLFAVRASDGSAFWQNDDFTYTSRPIVTNGLVVVAGRLGDGDVLAAVDADDGHTNWFEDTTIDVANSLVAADNVIVVRGRAAGGDPDGVMTAFTVGDGSQLWTVSTDRGTDYSLSVANGLLFTPSVNATNVYDLASGKRTTQLRGGQFAVVTDAGVVTAANSSASIQRLSLPGSQASSASRPAVEKLVPNRSLKVAS